MHLRIASWNVNGIRAVIRNGFLDWLERETFDQVCLQEVKALPENLAKLSIEFEGYKQYWHTATRRGYSGLLTLSKCEPQEVLLGMGIEKFDKEGRVLTTIFDRYILVNTYFPNSQRDHARLGYKLEFCAGIQNFLSELKTNFKLPIVLCGDFNIAHHPIDLANPKENENNAGFLPEERAWMTEFINSGFVDCFRMLNSGNGQYTWWSYRPTIRERNIGWRLDYFFLDKNSVKYMQGMEHAPQVLGSDHCPIFLTLKF